MIFKLSLKYFPVRPAQRKAPSQSQLTNAFDSEEPHPKVQGPQDTSSPGHTPPAFNDDFDEGSSNELQPQLAAVKELTKDSNQSLPAAVTKKVRKANPDAHANYRKLKIKSKNSKAKGRGTFGRGR